MKHRLFFLVFSWLLTIVWSTANSQSVRYVKPDDGRSTKNGLSWSTAYDQTQLQTAINSLSITGGQVWVAQGVYTPTTDVQNRNAYFSMRNRVGIYGGFPADPNLLLARNPNLYPTLLSGDIDGDGTVANNSYSIIINRSLNPDKVDEGIDSTAILDGFVISGGTSGGIFNEVSSPTITNCIITGNTASSGGGVVNFRQSKPRFINCLFAGNTAGSGGAMFNYNSFPRLINCILRDNSASAVGGALYNAMASYPLLVNCTLIGNSAPTNGGTAIASWYYCRSKLVNCILWNNGLSNAVVNQYYSNYSNFTYDVVLDHCLIEYREGTFKGYVGQYNIETLVSPFESITSLALQKGAAAIDAGSNDGYSVMAGPYTDITGQLRIQQGIIDLGAIEFNTVPSDTSLRLVENPVPAGRQIRFLPGDFRPTQLELFQLTGGALPVRATASPDGSILVLGSESLSSGYYILSASDGVRHKSVRVVVY